MWRLSLLVLASLLAAGHATNCGDGSFLGFKACLTLYGGMFGSSYLNCVYLDNGICKPLSEVPPELQVVGAMGNFARFMVDNPEAAPVGPNGKTVDLVKQLQAGKTNFVQRNADFSTEPNDAINLTPWRLECIHLVQNWKNLRGAGLDKICTGITGTQQLKNCKKFTKIVNLIIAHQAHGYMRGRGMLPNQLSQLADPVKFCNFISDSAGVRPTEPARYTQDVGGSIANVRAARKQALLVGGSPQGDASVDRSSEFVASIEIVHSLVRMYQNLVRVGFRSENMVVALDVTVLDHLARNNYRSYRRRKTSTGNVEYTFEMADEMGWAPRYNVKIIVPLTMNLQETPSRSCTSLMRTERRADVQICVDYSGDFITEGRLAEIVDRKQYSNADPETVDCARTSGFSVFASHLYGACTGRHLMSDDNTDTIVYFGGHGGGSEFNLLHRLRIDMNGFMGLYSAPTKFIKGTNPPEVANGAKFKTGNLLTDQGLVNLIHQVERKKSLTVLVTACHAAAMVPPRLRRALETGKLGNTAVVVSASETQVTETTGSMGAWFNDFDKKFIEFSQKQCKIDNTESLQDLVQKISAAYPDKQVGITFGDPDMLNRPLKCTYCEEAQWAPGCAGIVFPESPPVDTLTAWRGDFEENASNQTDLFDKIDALENDLSHLTDA